MNFYKKNKDSKFKITCHDSLPWSKDKSIKTIKFSDEKDLSADAINLLKRCQNLLEGFKEDSPVLGEISGIIIRITSIVAGLKMALTAFITVPAYKFQKIGYTSVESAKDVLNRRSQSEEVKKLAGLLKTDVKTLMKSVNGIRVINPKIILLKGLINTAGLGLLAYASWCISRTLLK